MTDNKYRIAIIGGTGAEGSGLAIRWAKAGHQIIIGSRDAGKAQTVAADLNGRLNSSKISGASFDDAAKVAEIVVLTVPFAAQISTVETLRSHLQGKILIDVTVPLVPPKVSQVQLPPTDSRVVAVQNTLADGVRVVSAVQNVSAHKLKDLNYEVQCDVLVCGNEQDAHQLVIGLARDAGLRGIDAGLLVNSTVAESLTSVLIWINRTYKIPDAGIAITGIA